MKIEKQLQNLEKNLQPSSMQEEKVLKRVLDSQESNLLRIFKMRNIFNFKVLGAGLFVILVLFGLPTALYIFNGPQSLNSNVAEFRVEREKAQQPAPNADGELQAESFGRQDDTTSGNYFKTSNNIIEDTGTQEQERAKENSANIAVSSPDTKKVYDDIKKLVGEYGGYVVRSSYNSNEAHPSSIEMRVPVDKFEEVLGAIRGMDLELVSESIDTIDRQNELTEKKSTLAENTSKIDELEQKLEEETSEAQKDLIRRQIESLKLQKNNLEESIDELEQDTQFSTIDVKINKDMQASNGLDFSETIEYVVTFWGTILIWILVPVILTLPVWLPVIIIARKKLKKNKQ